MGKWWWGGRGGAGCVCGGGSVDVGGCGGIVRCVWWTEGGREEGPCAPPQFVVGFGAGWGGGGGS